ncbi:MAG: hypothetical protein IPJ88_04120 [Myxococcales bacterium]|nr:MAG: hypothetical protein IPJ88_04120 [Myxococcales bacterium]
MTRSVFPSFVPIPIAVMMVLFAASCITPDSELETASDMQTACTIQVELPADQAFTDFEHFDYQLVGEVTEVHPATPSKIPEPLSISFNKNNDGQWNAVVPGFIFEHSLTYGQYIMTMQPGVDPQNDAGPSIVAPFIFNDDENGCRLTAAMPFYTFYSDNVIGQMTVFVEVVASPERCSSAIQASDFFTGQRTFRLSVQDSSARWLSRSDVVIDFDEHSSCAKQPSATGVSEEHLCTDPIPEVASDNGSSFCTTVRKESAAAQCFSLDINDSHALGAGGNPVVNIHVLPESYSMDDKGGLAEVSAYEVYMNYTCFNGVVSWRECGGINEGLFVGGCTGRPLSEQPFDAGLVYRIQNCKGTSDESGTAEICIKGAGVGSYKISVDVAAGYLH